MVSYLWRELSDKEQEEIKNQAKKIMDDFAVSLEKLPDIPEAVVERESDRREEGEKSGAEIDRDIMFANAPNVKGDCIVGEKGAWTK